MHAVLYDAAGHRRSPVTMPGFHEGRVPRIRVGAIRLTRRQWRRSSR